MMFCYNIWNKLDLKSYINFICLKFYRSFGVNVIMLEDRVVIVGLEWW